MSLRATFLLFLHRLLRVPPPAPVVQWRVPLQSWWWYRAEAPFSPPQDHEFTITLRPTNTLQ